MKRFATILWSELRSFIVDVVGDLLLYIKYGSVIAFFALFWWLLGLDDAYRNMLVSIPCVLLFFVAIEYAKNYRGVATDDGFGLKWATVAFFAITPFCVPLFLGTAPETTQPVVQTPRQLTPTEAQDVERGMNVLQDVMRKRREGKLPDRDSHSIDAAASLEAPAVQPIESE